MLDNKINHSFNIYKYISKHLNPQLKTEHLYKTNIQATTCMDVADKFYKIY